MPKGIVTTGRGQVLNLDELIRQSETPLGQKPEKATRERPSYSPEKSNKPKIRGFVPGKGEVDPPVVENENPEQEIVAAYSKDKKARKLSDLTGIRIDKPTKKTTQTETEEASSPDTHDEEEEVLGDIVKNLKTTKKDESQTEKSSAKSRRKSS